MTGEEADKARALRYKKAVLAALSYDSMTDEMYQISEECENISYFMSDDETLLNALDGDEDDECEFKMMFCELSAKCDNLMEAIRDADLQEYFDDFLVAIVGNKYNALGYDSYEEDYFHLTSYEGGLAQTESGKRIMRLTKPEMLSIAGQCFGTALAFLDVRYSYDYLKATFDILKDENTSILQIVKDIEAAYEEASKEDFYEYSDETRRFENLVSQLPERIWIEN